MSVGLYLTPQGDLAGARDVVRRAEALGYESVWTPHGLGRDALVLLTLWGVVTTRLGLGTGVLPILPRHPVALAQQALTLAEATGGRLRLGLGVSHAAVMEPAFGLTVPRPLATMREYVSALRAALSGRAFEGERWHFRSPLAPAARLAPPILLAALAPRMVELAGEIADGVIFWLCPPAWVRDVALPALERGRGRTGRSLAGFAIVAAVPVALGGADADDAHRRELVRYLGLPFYRAMFEASGFADAVHAFDADGRVPEALAEAVGRVGDASACAAYVAAYRDAGVTLPVVRPIGWPDAPWCRATIEAAAAW
jgi:alkanesulfonate monooxygenase SsuD/methylene tetrahydromethanopterin reductase-like flavin-dependent oxidoreductase (luciferase family)